MQEASKARDCRETGRGKEKEKRRVEGGGGEQERAEQWRWRGRGGKRKETERDWLLVPSIDRPYHTHTQRFDEPTDSSSVDEPLAVSPTFTPAAPPFPGEGGEVEGKGEEGEWRERR